MVCRRNMNGKVGGWLVGWVRRRRRRRMSKKRQKQPVQRNLSVEKFNIKESRRHLLEPVQILPFLTLSLSLLHPPLLILAAIRSGQF